MVDEDVILLEVDEAYHKEDKKIEVPYLNL